MLRLHLCLRCCGVYNVSLCVLAHFYRARHIAAWSLYYTLTLKLKIYIAK